MVDDLGQTADWGVRRTLVRLHQEHISEQVQSWIEVSATWEAQSARDIQHRLLHSNVV